MDQKLTEATAEVQTLREQTSKAEEEAKNTDLENKALKEKNVQLESGSNLNQNTIDNVMQKFFSSEAWKDAQIDNFISFSELLQP